MRNVIVGALLVVLSLAMTGCATQGVNSYKYTEPITAKIENERVVDQPYSTVWDKLVKQISKSFYVINNIDKESRIINLSFNTDNPDKYIDCGKSIRTFTQGDKVEEFAYNVSASSSYKYAPPEQPHFSWSSYHILNRNTKLEGRSNIYIAPTDTDNNKTVVSVNTRYIWEVAVTGNFFVQHFAGRTVHNGPTTGLGPASVISFNTNSEGTESGVGDKIICISRGTLEKDILNLIDAP